jgi:hypothetical protein
MMTSIVQAVNATLAEYDFPLTLRQIYYRLVASGLIPNKRSAYNQLSKTLVKARENGEVDDTRIEDRARQVLKGKGGFDDPDQFVDAMKSWFKSAGERYNADLWADQPVFVEVWVEKDALSRVIAQAAEPYRVTICPSRGYSSYTYIKRMAIDDRFSDVDKPIIILDFRDHDPSGIQMTEDLEKRLVNYGEGLDIEVKRIALTIDQVNEYKLIPNPTKLADPRSQAYVVQYGDQCWELDAIEPRELQRIVKAAIEKHIDREVWDHSLEHEQKDKTSLTERFANATLEV